MLNRILRYVIVWASMLAVLCVLSIIKYRHEILNSIGGMVSEIAVPIITLAGIVLVISMMFRR